MSIATAILVRAWNSEDAKQLAEMEEVYQHHFIDGETVYTFTDKSQLTIILDGLSAT